MSDQIDISREACERSAQALHELAEPFGKPCAEGLMITALRAALDAAEAEKARAVEAERERCAVIAEGIDAEAFRARYDVTYTKKRFDKYSHEKGVNNALSIQAEDAAAAIRTGAKP